MKIRKTKIQEQQIQADNTRKRALMEAAFDKWSKTDVGEGLRDLRGIDEKRALTTAFMVERQEQLLKKLREDTISQNYGQRPENVLKIVRLGVANSNRQNIIHEFPMSTTDDAMWYITPHYAKTLRGATAGDNLYESKDHYSVGENGPVTLGTGDGGTTTFTYTAAPALPTRRYSYKVLVNGAISGVDNGTGIVGDGYAGTIDYATGEVVVEFAVAPALDTTIQLIYGFDSEVVDNYPLIQEVTFELIRHQLKAKPVPLGYNVSGMVNLMLSTTTGYDAEETMLQFVGMAHAKFRDYRAVALLSGIANRNPIVTFNADFAGSGEASEIDHVQKLRRTINITSNRIRNQVGRGDLNRILVGFEADAYIRDIRGFEEDTSQPRVGGIYLLGRLDGREIYTVVQDGPAANLIAPNEMILTHQGQEDGDIAVAFGVLAEMVDSLTYPEHHTRGQVTAVEDHVTVEPRFVRKIRLENMPLED